LFFLKDRRQQLLLNVDHHQRATFGLERAPCDLGLICGCVLNHGRHIVTSFRLLDEMSALRADVRSRRSIRSLSTLWKILTRCRISCLLILFKPSLAARPCRVAG
jgi:hypothetical protein